MSAPPSPARLPLFARASLDHPNFAADAPVTRADCLSGGPNAARPCPWLSCDHHALLGLLSGAAGPELLADPSDESILATLALIPASCVLDLADRGATLDEIADLWGVSQQRANQVERDAMRRMRLRGLHNPVLKLMHAQMGEEPARDVDVPTVHRCGPVGLTAVETAHAQRAGRVWRPEPTQPAGPVLGPTSETPASALVSDVSEPQTAPLGSTSAPSVEEPPQTVAEPVPEPAPQTAAAPVQHEPPTDVVTAPITTQTPEEQPVPKPMKTAKQPKKTAPKRRAEPRTKPAGRVPAVVSELRALTESLAAMFGGGR